jgi:Spy/CpxP family protein refolding chaperone
MKHIIALIAMAASFAVIPAFTSTVRAADEPRKERPGGGQFLEKYREVIEKLDLSTDQKTKIDAAFADAKTKIAAVLKDAAGDKEAARGKIRPIFKELHDTVVAVLTPEQKEKLEKERPQRKPPAK